MEGLLLGLRRGVRFFAVVAMVCALAAAGAKAASFEELAAGAATARRGNNIPQAIEFYRQAVQLRPSWVEGWWFLGTLSYATFQYADGEAAFDEFVKLDDKRALAWSLLGLCEFETGKYDLALDHLRRGLADKDLPPEVEAGVRFHYGLLLSRAGNFDLGKRELERYARGGAHEPLLIAALGLNALHDPLLPKDVPADQMDAVMQAGAAARSLILGETGQAESGMQLLAKQYPAMAGVHYLYGSYLSYTRPDDAMAELRRELELNPENADASALLALLLVHAGDVPGALPFARKAAGARPGDGLAQYAYGEVLMRSGDLRPAIATLEAAERLDPAALEYHMALASAYSRAGRLEDARRERHMSMDMAGDKRPELNAQSSQSGDARPAENQ